MVYQLTPFLEAMFDLSLVALGAEILLELCSTVLTEKKKWLLYGLVAAGIPTQIPLVKLTCQIGNIMDIIESVSSMALRN